MDAGGMETLSLIEAAAFLKMHPEEVRRRAKTGIIPGAKAGRAWVFITEDLAGYLRSLYPQAKQSLQARLRREVACRFANEGLSGGSISTHPTESEYANLLGLPTKRSP